MLKEVYVKCPCGAEGKSKADVPPEVVCVKAACPKCQKEGKHLMDEGKPVPYEKCLF